MGCDFGRGLAPGMSDPYTLDCWHACPSFPGLSCVGIGAHTKIANWFAWHTASVIGEICSAINETTDVN